MAADTNTKVNGPRNTLTRKAVHSFGWLAVKRLAKNIPFGGTFVAIALVGSDIKRKGFIRGIFNSALDATPVVGLLKNGVELFTGDLIPDRVDRTGGNFETNGNPKASLEISEKQLPNR